MATSIMEARGECIVHRAQERGYHIVYREQETNHCPGCGRTHWYVGRVSAECAFCSTALPLVEAVTGNGSHRPRIRHGAFANAA